MPYDKATLGQIAEQEDEESKKDGAFLGVKKKFDEVRAQAAKQGREVRFGMRFHVIPREHWNPLYHMIRSFRRGTPASFRARRGLRAIDPEMREELRVAVVGRLPRERLQHSAGDEGARRVRALRTFFLWSLAA